MRSYARPDRYFSNTLSSARARAKKVGMPFDITREWLLERAEVQGWRCHYSGVFLTLGGGRRSMCPTNASIDRIDPAKGYTRENTVICALAVNVAKNIWTIDDLLAWADRIREWTSSEQYQRRSA